jgi:acetyl esterase/lipase
MIAAALLVLAAQNQVEHGVTYSRQGGAELKMDIYRPKDAPSALPAVLIIHGGAWMNGDRTAMATLASGLAAKGFVAATLDYRLAPASHWPAMLDDCQAAVRFLRANATRYQVDPRRVAAAGPSAGGHLALLLGTRETRIDHPPEYPEQSSKVEAVLDFFGPTDFSQDWPHGDYYDAMFEAVLGKPRAEAEEDLRLASPINYVDKDSAPVFIFQGLADPLVRPHQSQLLEAKYRSLGLPVKSIYVEGVGHELPFNNPKVRSAVVQAITWLEQQLKKAA